MSNTKTAARNARTEAASPQDAAVDPLDRAIARAQSMQVRALGELQRAGDHPDRLANEGERRRRVRHLGAITWYDCAGYARTQRCYHGRWNCDSCYPHRQGRPHRPSWARLSHVKVLPREMRPKRYLPQESKTDSSRSFNPQYGFGQNFFVSWVISSWNMVQIGPHVDSVAI